MDNISIFFAEKRITEYICFHFVDKTTDLSCTGILSAYIQQIYDAFYSELNPCDIVYLVLGSSLNITEFIM